MKNLSIGSALAWQIAALEAGAAHHQYIDKEHVLIGILSLEKKIKYDLEKSGVEAAQEIQVEYRSLLDLLGGFGIDPAKLRRDIRQRMGKGNYRHIEKTIHRSEACKKVFERANELATNSKEITCLHFLAAILEEPGSIIVNALNLIGIEPSVLQALRVAFAEQSLVLGKKLAGEKHAGQVQAGGITPFLARYGRNLSQEARDGRLGPFIGRRKELLQVIQTLARRSKNNPVLVGEAEIGRAHV